MKLVGNCNNIIDWDTVIDSIKDNPGTILHYNDKTYNKTIKGFDQMAKEWEEAGYQYDDPAIEWINYFPVSDFSKDVQDAFADMMDVKPFMVWISKIKPLRMAPWHFDAHTKIDTLKDNTIIRYVCYIQKPSFGHASIVGDVAVYMPEQGSIYQWDNWDVYHCGMNGGYTDKYMFNFWGYR